jgi:serine/threonine protein kinase
LAKTQTADSSGGVSCTSVFGYTPRYAPLEQIQDLGTSPQSDIYALGATLYHLLTGVKPPDALARATALVSARPNPLKPANEIIEAVGVELAAILTRAMAQNPDERYATAAEFREALRQIGRVEAADVEYVTRKSEIEPAVVEIEETAIIRSARVSSTSRLGSHAVAALFLILLAAFGVFCSYYPWKIPPTQAQTVSAETIDCADAQTTGRDSRARIVTNQKNRPTAGKSFAESSPLQRRARKSARQS